MKQLYSMTLLFILFSLLGCTSQEVDNASSLPIVDKDHITISNFKHHPSDTTSINKQIKYATQLYDKNFDSAKFLLLHAFENSQHIKYDKGTVNALSSLGHIYTAKGYYDTAVICFKKALLYADRLPKESGTVSYFCNAVAASYSKLSNNDSASVYLYKSIDALEKHTIKDYKKEFAAYDNAVRLWISMGNTQTILPYLEKAQNIALAHKDAILLTYIQFDKGGFYFNSQQKDSAIKYYQYCLKDSVTPIEVKIQSNIALGNIYIDKGLFNDGLSSFQQAEYLSEKTHDYYNANIAEYSIGNAYFAMKNYKQATKVYFDVIKNNNANLGKTPAQYMMIMHRNLMECYYYLKMYDKSFEENKAALALVDSVYEREKMALMNKLDVQYRVGEKDKQLAENKIAITAKNLWIAGIGVASLISIFILVGLLYRKLHKEEVVRLKATLEGEEKERKRLAYELHDGIVSRLCGVKLNFTSLPTHYQDISYTENFHEAIQQLEQSINELRTISHNLLPEVLQQEGLATAIHIFCEKINKVSPIAISFQLVGVLPSLKMDFELAIYRIVQEQIHNVIKHSGANQALVQIIARDNWISITIDDNGVGISSKVLQSSDGIGFQSLHSRVRAMNGTLSIENNNGSGTSIYLEFDLKKQMKKSTS